MSAPHTGHRFGGITALEVSSDAAGIRIEAAVEGDRDTTVTLLDRRGAELDELLELRQEGHELHVRVRTVREGRWKRNRNVDARLTITTPLATEVVVSTDAGAVRVERREAPVRVEAHVGAIELTAVLADVDVRSDAGAVRVVDGIGSVTALSQAGAITLLRHQGERVDLRATAGSITATKLEVGELEAHTEAGAIRIEHATPPVRVNASCTVGTASIELPVDEYEIEQHVGGLGRARIEGLESVSGAARHVRVATSGLGAVTVRAASGVSPTPA